MTNFKNRIPVPSEGESNSSSKRTEWEAKNHNTETRAILEEDASYFLRQSVSSPCLSVVTKAEGAYIEDTNGRRYLDFHGNNVHHIGYGHPKLKKAIAEQMDALPFAPEDLPVNPHLRLQRNWLKLLQVIFPRSYSQQEDRMRLKWH